MKSGEPATPNRVVPVAGSLVLFLAFCLSAQDSTFIVSTTDPTYGAPAFIRNGAFSLVSTPLGSTASLSYASGVYDHGPGDVPLLRRTAPSAAVQGTASNNGP